MNVKTAVILGASGSVGQAVLAEIAGCAAFGRVIAVTRRPLSELSVAGVEERLVPHMRPETLAAAVLDALRNIEPEVLGLSVLGVGAGTAKLSLQAHRAIDVAQRVGPGTAAAKLSETGFRAT